MKTLFIEAKSELDITKVLKKVKAQGKAGIITTIQHAHKIDDARKVIPDAVIGGVVLGCDVSAAEKIKDQIDYFIYIGTGKFHPLGVALKTRKKVIVANPLTNQVSEISDKEIEDYKKRLKGKYLKFLNARKIGVLVSTKAGQYDLGTALGLQERLEKPSYIFMANNFSEKELENYPDIDMFINTACPRVEFDKVVNIADIDEMVEIFG